MFFPETFEDWGDKLRAKQVWTETRDLRQAHVTDDGMAHPLSPNEPALTTRRPRLAVSSVASIPSRPVTNYFDLKRESDARVLASNAFVNGDDDSTPLQWSAAPHSASTPLPLRRRPSSAAVLESIMDGDESLTPDDSSYISGIRQVPTTAGASSLATPALVLKTSWHELDNSSIDAVLTTSNALRDALRVISRALDDTNARYAELQAIRQRESGAEERARQRVKKIMWDLDEKQREVARAIVDAVYAEDPEEVLAIPLDSAEDVDNVRKLSRSRLLVLLC